MCPRFERKKGIKSSDFVIAEIGFKKILDNVLYETGIAQSLGTGP